MFLKEEISEYGEDEDNYEIFKKVSQNKEEVDEKMSQSNKKCFVVTYM